MSQFAYQARNAQGRLIAGTIDAATERDAAQALQAQGLVPTRLELAMPLTAAGALANPARPTVPSDAQAAARAQTEVAAALAPGAGAAFRTAGGSVLRVNLGDAESELKRPGLLQSLTQPKVSPKALALFCRQFATMIGAGLSILSSLRTMGGQVTDRRLRQMIYGVADRIEAGLALSAAFANYVPEIPELVVHMVRAGEAGGVLEEVFVRLADQLERENALNDKVRAALVYPRLVMGAAVVMMLFLMATVIPSFVDLFSQFDVQMPAVTRAVMNTSHWLRAHIILVVSVLVALYLGWRILPATQWGRIRLDALALRVPILGELYLKRAMSRLTRTLGTLLDSGVPILSALRVAEKTLDNFWLEQALRRAEENVRSGRSLAGPLRDERLFPRLMVELVSVGEETGALDQMLFKAADHYEQETNATVARLTAVLEPILIIGMALVVGGIMAAVFLPMYQMLGSIE